MTMSTNDSFRNQVAGYKAGIADRHSVESLRAICYDINKSLVSIRASLATDIDIKLLNQLIELSIRHAYAKDLLERLEQHSGTRV